MEEVIQFKADDGVTARDTTLLTVSDQMNTSCQIYS